MRDRKRYRSIDGLRGIAAASVLVFHVWRYIEAHTHERQPVIGEYLLNELRLGLYLFFALSGFLLFRPFVSAATGSAQAPRVGTFIRHRVARIAPAYYVCIAVTLALLWGTGGSAQFMLPASGDLWLFAVFGQNYSGSSIMTLNPPTWTLAVEMAFYVILPLIGAAILALRGRAWPLIAAPVAMVAVGLVWNYTTIHSGEVTRMALPAMLPYFACGMIAAVAVELRARAGAPISASGRLLLVAGLGCLVLNTAMHHVVAIGALNAITRDLPAAVGFGLILTSIASRTHPNRLLASRPLAALGTVSYGLYLWHVPVIMWGRTQGLLPEQTWAAAPIVFAVSLALAAVSWYAIERPAMRLARRRRTRAPRDTIPAPHPASGRLNAQGVLVFASQTRPPELRPELARGR